MSNLNSGHVYLCQYKSKVYFCNYRLLWIKNSKDHLTKRESERESLVKPAGNCWRETVPTEQT